MGGVYGCRECPECNRSMLSFPTPHVSGMSLRLGCKVNSRVAQRQWIMLSKEPSEGNKASMVAAKVLVARGSVKQWVDSRYALQGMNTNREN